MNRARINAPLMSTPKMNAPTQRDLISTGASVERIRRALRGNTLIEVLVALASLLIVVSSFAGAYVTALRISKHQRYTTQAIALLESTSETLIMMNRTDAALDLGLHSETYSHQGDYTESSDAFYTIQWQVSDYAASSGIFQIDLSVLWDEEGNQRTIAWSTWK